MLEDATLASARLSQFQGTRRSGLAMHRLRALAAPLRGLRALHISATGYGGGVAELLRSKIPLLRSLGLTVDWKLLRADPAFFAVTKKLHNGLQGAPVELSAEEEAIYERESSRNAALLAADSAAYDVIVVHDPQPAALVGFHGRRHCRWVWRCHLDSSPAQPACWRLLQPHLAGYDAAVFTLDAFAPRELPIPHTHIIAPAIDPAAPKNIALRSHTMRRIVAWMGIDVSRPVMTQVSRFDPWKDPLGVIAAYRLARREVPGLQLALVGSMALDDPEGWLIHREVMAAAAGDPDLHVFNNLNGAGNIEVNALQRLSRVVVQKSIREGFGLTVAEALWKGTPVVATRTGGIPLQIPADARDCLVESVEACAAAVVRMAVDARERERIGALGRAHVATRFLLPRLVEDELRLYAATMARPCDAAAGPPAAGHAAA